MTAAKTDTEQISLLRAAVARSGLSDRRFAARVLVRDERSMRRWLSGESPIPRAVLDHRYLRDTIPPRVIAWLDA